MNVGRGGNVSSVRGGIVGRVSSVTAGTGRANFVKGERGTAGSTRTIANLLDVEYAKCFKLAFHFPFIHLHFRSVSLSIFSFLKANELLMI